MQRPWSWRDGAAVWLVSWSMGVTGCQRLGGWSTQGL